MLSPSAKIGPNAIIQLGETFAARQRLADAAEIYGKAGCLPLLDRPPDSMVDEAIVARLFTAVALGFNTADAVSLLSEAGSRTGDYILANRIPAIARQILPLLPSRLALRGLLKAIQTNAWTFAGSGRFSHAFTGKPHINIAQNRIATVHGCVWHVAVFSRIFSRLLRSPAMVSETACCGRGDARCHFDIQLA